MYDCINLKNIDISSLNLNNVINMDYMFGYCSNLKNIIFPEPVTISLIAKGEMETILWSSSYNNVKDGWMKICLERYVQRIDGDYYVTCTDIGIKTTLQLKVVMENPSSMKYF